jgi:sarcosine oxidase subunit delta
MRIRCPFCGERETSEFTYFGANAPRPGSEASLAQMYNSVYVRENPSGPNDELWYHAAGCRAWLLVRRDTRTHEMLSVAFASETVS